MRKKPDLSLYLVTDRGLSKGRPLEDIASAAAAGGASAVQLREKNCSTREYIHLAEKVQKALRPYGTALIINDRVDVAQAVSADGVHLGNSDMPCGTARRILGPHALIGCSVESVEDAKQAETLDVDYLGVSPVFATPTKTDTAEPLGLEGLAAIAAFSRHPLVAIGGINQKNAAAVIQNGASGIAVVSAICAAENPEKAAMELDSIIAVALKNQH